MFRQRHLLLIIFLNCLVWLGFTSCEDLVVTTNPNARLTLSADTVSFQTLFTGVGSATKTFKIYNPSKNSVKIDAIELVGSTNYVININGVMTDALYDVQLKAKDSMTIFVQVIIDPTEQTTPFIVKDSILITSNTNNYKVLLQAYGQDAYRISKREIGSDTTWLAEKPYLILDTLTIAENATLTLSEGVELYFVKKGSLQVYGTLKAKGKQAKPVVFRGDRMDNMFDNLPYDKVPTQWQGIRFKKQSTNNELDYVVVKNTHRGIELDSTSLDNVSLRISNSIISNSATSLITATHSVMHISNSVLYNAGQSCLVLRGGKYDVIHSTIANYFAFPWVGRKGSSVVLSNFVDKNAQAIPLPLERANFVNSIVYGTWSQEVSFLTKFLNQEVDATFEYLFKNSLIRMRSADINELYFVDVIVNQDPLFNATKPYTYDFTLQSNSPAAGIADVSVAANYPFDILGNQRIFNEKADMGAYVILAE
jgi:hypothetical protein